MTFKELLGKMMKNRRGRRFILLMVLIIIIFILGTALIIQRCSSSDVPKVEQTQTESVTRDSVDSAAPDNVVENVDQEQDDSLRIVADSVAKKPVTGRQRLEAILLGNDESELLYGLPVSEYEVVTGEIDRGQTFSKLLNGKFGLNIGTVNELVDKSKKVFNLRDLRAGNSYTAFLSNDTTEQVLQYLVYDKSTTEYVVFDCNEKSPSARVEKRDVTTVERYAEGVINSSLLQTIIQSKLPPALAYRLNDIFKWTIDFDALQKGDSFRVIYEELIVDTVRMGVSKIYGAEFIHNDKSYMAISFEQGNESGYWDASGVNLRKEFLKSPLNFQARISSRFGMRIHPIKRTRGQHNGVDYACASGTPVHAIANGTVIFAGWDRGGGGNTLKIRHSQGLTSGYLHLRNFARGIKNGSRVSQGDVIGYVGSTGMSTGPHLDYRIWRGGTAVDPLKMHGMPSNPISSGNKTAFNQMKNDILKVMDEYKK